MYLKTPWDILTFPWLMHFPRNRRLDYLYNYHIQEISFVNRLEISLQVYSFVTIHTCTRSRPLLKIFIVAHVKEDVECLPIAIAFRGEDVFVKCPVHTYSWNYNKIKEWRKKWNVWAICFFEIKGDFWRSFGYSLVYILKLLSVVAIGAGAVWYMYQTIAKNRLIEVSKI